MSPNEKAVNKAHIGSVDLISYATLKGMIEGRVMPEFASFESQPEIEGCLQPPKILRDKNPPEGGPMEGGESMETEEAAAAKVTFTGVALRKRKEASTPEGTPERPNLVIGSILLGKKGLLDVSNIRKNKCKYVSVVHATLRVPHGDIKNLVMELMFMGLDTLRAEDKSICFLHPNDPNQKQRHARTCQPSSKRHTKNGWSSTRLLGGLKTTSKKDGCAPTTFQSG